MVVKKTLILFTSIIISLVVVEALFRILINIGFIEYPNSDLKTAVHQYSSNKDLVYELKPSFSSQDRLIVTNEFGMRDYEYTLRKPSDVIRICVIGDSVAFGYRASQPILPMSKTFAKLLEVKLNDEYSQKYEVLNFSVTGYNSAQEEIVLKEKVLQFEPDVIILSFVPNDNTYTDGLGDLAKEMSPQSLGSRLHSKFISYLLHRYERRNFGKWNDIKQVLNLFKQLEILSSRHNFKVIILISRIKNHFEINSTQPDLMNQVASAHNFTVFDLKEIWQEVPPEIRNTYYADYLHFSEVGMQKIAAMLFEHFKSTPIKAQAFKGE